MPLQVKAHLCPYAQPLHPSGPSTLVFLDPCHQGYFQLFHCVLSDPSPRTSFPWETLQIASAPDNTAPRITRALQPLQHNKVAADGGVSANNRTEKI